MYKVISVNAGSSSLKYKVFEMPEEKVLCSGLADRIMHDDAIFRIKYDGKKFEKVLPIKDHAKAVELLLEALIEHGIVKDLNELKCVGHRVVQGGKYFSKSVDFNEDTEAKITKLIPLDPLHAPAHLVGYHAFKKALPDAKVIAVFDTAYHQTMEPEDYVFPIPYEIFGGKAEGTRIISCHIGSGASLCAIKDGKCVATSMGLTPLGGVMMGTRSGDLDPSVVDYLCNQTGKSVDEIYDILNKKSGLLGVSGISNDTRDVEKAAAEGNERAILTIKLYARRVADYIGQYFVRLGGADLIIFSAGVGENGPIYRETILKDVEEALNLKVDYKLNVEKNGQEAIISKPESKIKVAIIPTDEEIMIARDCYKAIEGTL